MALVGAIVSVGPLLLSGGDERRRDGRWRPVVLPRWQRPRLRLLHDHVPLVGLVVGRRHELVALLEAFIDAEDQGQEDQGAEEAGADGRQMQFQDVKPL